MENGSAQQKRLRLDFDKENFTKAFIVGILVGVVVLSCVCCGCFACCKARKNKENVKDIMTTYTKSVANEEGNSCEQSKLLGDSFMNNIPK